jgi:hypothetical protein
MKICCAYDLIDGSRVYCDQLGVHAALSPDSGTMYYYCARHFDLMVERLRHYEDTGYAVAAVQRVRKANPGLL